MRQAAPAAPSQIRVSPSRPSAGICPLRPSESPCRREGKIGAKLTTYVINGSGDVKRLKGHGGGCRLRVGDWRVIFIEDARSITVIAVGNRREIYD